MRVIISLCLICSLLVSFPSLAADSSANSNSPKRIMVVLDASGSMRGLTRGETKMAVAKKVLTDLVASWNDKDHVGLMAYGHRSKGDCKDIEVLVPVSELNKDKLHKAIQAISPKGKTPLTNAVLQAATAMLYTENKSTVILISDGKETCNRDPCNLAKELKAKGIDFTVHVIGFSVNKAEQGGLRCLAKHTGGSFFEANNADELKDALKKVTKKTKEAPANNLVLQDPNRT